MSRARTSGTVLFEDEDEDILVTTDYVTIGGQSVPVDAITFAGWRYFFKPMLLQPEWLLIGGALGLLVSVGNLIVVALEHDPPLEICVIFGGGMICSVALIVLAFTVFRRQINTFAVNLMVNDKPIVLHVGPNKKVLDQVVEAIRKAMADSRTPGPGNALPPTTGQGPRPRDEGRSSPNIQPPPTLP